MVCIDAFLVDRRKHTRWGSGGGGGIQRPTIRWRHTCTWNRVASVTVCVVFASLFQLLLLRLHAVSGRVWASERASEYMGILYFLLLICVFVQFALLQINHFYRHFQLFHSRPMSRSLYTHTVNARSLVCLRVCLINVFFGVAYMKIFQYQMNLRPYGPYSARVSVCVHMRSKWKLQYECVCRFLYTQAPIHTIKCTHTFTSIWTFLNDCTFIMKDPTKQQKRQIE